MDGFAIQENLSKNTIESLQFSGIMLRFCFVGQKAIKGVFYVGDIAYGFVKKKRLYTIIIQLFEVQFFIFRMMGCAYC